MCTLLCAFADCAEIFQSIDVVAPKGQGVELW